MLYFWEFPAIHFAAFLFMYVPFPFCQKGVTMRVCFVLAIQADVDYFTVNLICGISQTSTFTRRHVFFHIFVFMFHPAPPGWTAAFCVPSNSDIFSGVIQLQFYTAARFIILNLF